MSSSGVDLKQYRPVRFHHKYYYRVFKPVFHFTVKRVHENNTLRFLRYDVSYITRVEKGLF